MFVMIKRAFTWQEALAVGPWATLLPLGLMWVGGQNATKLAGVAWLGLALYGVARARRVILTLAAGAQQADEQRSDSECAAFGSERKSASFCQFSSPQKKSATLVRTSGAIQSPRSGTLRRSLQLHRAS